MSLLFHGVLETLATTISLERKINIGNEEVKLSLFTADMIVYI